MDNSTVWVLGVTCVGLLASTYSIIIYPVFLHPLAKIPGPKPTHFPFTILGNLPEIFAEEAAAPYMRYAKKYRSGVIRYFHIFNRPRLFVYSSTGLRRIFGTHASKYGKDTSVFTLLNRVLGKGLLTVEDQFHKRQRQIINPVFRVKQINSLIPVFISSGKELCNTWIAQLNSSPSKSISFELASEMSKPTLDVIGRAGFGYEFNAVAEGHNPLYEQYKLVLNQMNLVDGLIRAFAPFVNWLIPSRRKASKEFDFAAGDIQKYCREILETRKSAIRDGNESANDLLTVLLKANSSENEKTRLTDEEVMAQAMTFLGAGHETTSVALTWTIDFLANNPAIQEKLRKELKEHLPLTDSEPSEDFITSSKTYLDAVCKESLRLVPPAPLVSRMALEDDEIDGYFVPKGTAIFVSAAVNHRLEEYWGPDALEFKPERWLETSTKEDDDDNGKAYGAYMPFMLGPRNCIGQRFAMLELKSILAVLVRGFEFIKVEQGVVKKKLSLTWKPHPGLQMKVKKVD